MLLAKNQTFKGAHAMKTIRLTLFALLLQLTSSLCLADDAVSSNYPKTFAIFGAYSGIDTRAQTISINDREYRYDVNVKVHGKTSNILTINSLQRGMTLGANQLAGKNTPIVEIWVLPSNYRPDKPSFSR
jgi:hypothetical protein